MPFKLVAPRKGKSPNFSIRGTHLRVYVDTSSGTNKRSLAGRKLREIEQAIERGDYPARAPAPGPTVVTFLSAAVAYLEAGRRRRYVARLIKYFGETPAAEVDQAAIDRAAAALHPNTTPATRNTCVYTPVSAILHHAGINIGLRRPKGAKGRTITDALEPADAFAIIAAAETFDREYALLLRFLLYTGVRLGEALRLTWDDLRLAERGARVRVSKTGVPRELVLRRDLVARLAAHPNRRTGTVFRFRQGGWLKWKLLRARLIASGMPAPKRPSPGAKRKVTPHRLSWVNHHTFRHTWATWMRRYGGLDGIGLAATDNWQGERGASRYAHAVAREEWNAVEDLPGERDAG